MQFTKDALASLPQAALLATSSHFTPQPQAALLERVHKTIIPFCTNEGSGMGSSERDLRKKCKGANVEQGLSIHGAEAEQSEKQVTA